jgi:hypothetical protein
MLFDAGINSIEILNDWLRHGREKQLLKAMVKAVLNAGARLILARGCGTCWKRWTSV